MKLNAGSSFLLTISSFQSELRNIMKFTLWNFYLMESHGGIVIWFDMIWSNKIIWYLFTVFVIYYHLANNMNVDLTKQNIW